MLAPHIPPRIAGPLIEEAGVYEMPAARYHADPIILPSLSASLAIRITQQSPLHGWHSHPRLNPDYAPPESTDAQAEGEALHSLILDRADRIAILPFDDLKSAKAQNAYHLAKLDGLIPLKRPRAAALRKVAEAVRRQLDAHPEDADAFTNGAAERVLVWQEETAFGPIWCRARVDWIGVMLDDLKTLDGRAGANPEEWSRTATNEGRFVQAVHYLRGAMVLGLKVQGFRFVLVERSEPFAVATVSPTPALFDYALKQWEAAAHLFAEGLHRNVWPGYPARRWWAELPRYLDEKHAARTAAVARIRKHDSGVVPRVAQSGMPFA